jgi:hypothetical protein
MNISHNFVSVVALGYFNPAIVTPDFLNKVCLLNLGDPVEVSPSNIPVVRALRFRDFDIHIDLTHLTITEKPVRDIRNTRILNIFKSYYEKLPFTPLSAVGININCEISFLEDAAPMSLPKKARDAGSILDFFGVGALELSEKIRKTKQQDEWKASNYTIENVKDLFRRIDIQKKENAVVLNYNSEAPQLDKEPQKLKILLEQYEDFCTEFDRFLKLLGV